MRVGAVIGGVFAVAILAPRGQPPSTIRTEVNLVQLSATVTETNGRTVSGLGKEAFELFVDGVRCPITIFLGEDAPVTAGIVVDNSASMAPKRADVVQAALSFARASNPHDQMFIVHFSDSPWFGLPDTDPFTGDISKLELAISQFHLGGTTALYDALRLALTRFQIAAYSRRVLLLITDGGDNSSKWTVEDALAAARANGASLYAIGIFDARDRDRKPQVLTQLAEATGGMAFFPATSAEVAGVCERIAGDIRHQYTLGFAGAQDGKYHGITLTVQDARHNELQVHTRDGYFAPKPDLVSPSHLRNRD
jgi:VWFA-related protein